MNNEILVKVENVSKKFCRKLKRSLFYGVQDMSREIFGMNGKHDKLRKDEFWAVKDVSFELRRGECLGLIGHNGAGKSTLLKMLNGLIKPDQGKITMRGRIGALIELGAGFNPILTGRENVYINGQVLGFTKKEIDAKFDAIVEFAEIGKFIDSPVMNYSSGMKVRLGFAVAAQMEPDVLLIDEVLAVGDIGFRTKCLNRIQELLINTVIIFVSHSMTQIARISNKCVLMNNGFIDILSYNVPVVIDHFFGKFELGKTEIFSKGTLEINRFLINKQVTNNIIFVSYNSNITLNLKIDIIDEYVDLKKLILRCSIWDQEFIPIIEVLNAVGKFFSADVINNKANFIIEVPNIRIKEGKHTISIILLDIDNNVLFRAENFAAIQIGHNTPSAAKTFIHSK